MSTNTVLTCMTEEKENRVIEMLLTSTRVRDLLFSKLGLRPGVTQVLLTMALTLGVGAASDEAALRHRPREDRPRPAGDRSRASTR
jgi:ABC-type Na+ efflux pump permease subunit